MEITHTFVVLAYKESPYLEQCLLSVLDQTLKGSTVIATSTPCQYISTIAQKYNIDVITNPDPEKGIGHDFDFAVSCGHTDLVTVAHQDDIYDKTYREQVISTYKKSPNSLIVFTDYYEIRDGNKVVSNLNLKIKRFLLIPLRCKMLGSTRFVKRWTIRFGNAICCPAVTFSKENIKTNSIFKCKFKCDVDWYAWEKLSLEKGAFTYIKHKLMGHRVHDLSTTTEIINDNIRTKEDLVMFSKFWPKPISKLLNKWYIKSEESNK
jgi:Glycosyl transferase family 2.